MITQYVVGFAFDDLGRVALIKKLHPEWQAGKWNGIGGHIEDGETSKAAMEREFFEETGVRLDESLWQRIGRMHGQVGFEVDVYAITHERIRNVQTATDEEIKLFPMWQIPRDTIDNIQSLLQLANLCISGNPTFVITYE